MTITVTDTKTEDIVKYIESVLDCSSILPFERSEALDYKKRTYALRFNDGSEGEARYKITMAESRPDYVDLVFTLEYHANADEESGFAAGFEYSIVPPSTDDYDAGEISRQIANLWDITTTIKTIK